MTILLDGAGGIFPIYRKIEAALAAANTAQLTTIPAAIESLLDEIAGELSDVDTNAIGSALSEATKSFRSQSSLQRALLTFANSITISRVTDDAPEIPAAIAACIAELIRQMVDSSDTVERNVASASLSVSPSGAPVLLVSDKRGDGSTIESLLPETIIGVYQSGNLRLTSGAAERDATSPLWPKGSATNATLSVTTDGLLLNGSFDTDVARPGTPDNWTITVGTPGTSVVLTQTEIQTITINGGPASGMWTITFTRASDSFAQTTEPLSFDAAAADVEAALAALIGLETVTVTATGTLPSAVVYTVNFEGIAGNQTAFSTANTFNTGSIGIAESQAGSAYSQTARALTFNGNGSELTAVRQGLHSLSLKPLTHYGLSVMLKAKTAAMGGVLVMEIVDGAGTTLADDAGTGNSLSITLSSISHTAFVSKTLSIRLPSDVPDIFYLRFRLSTAITAAQAIYLDDCVLAESSELYRGGPRVNLFPNTRNLQASDRYEIAVANNFAGKLQTLFVRFFNSQLPSDVSASETIPD